MEIFHGWGQFMQLAYTTVIMVVVLFVMEEIGTFLAGTIGPVPLAVQGLCINVNAITFGVPLAFGIAAGIRVGQNLGNESALGAKTTVRVALIVNCKYWSASWKSKDVFRYCC